MINSLPYESRVNRMSAEEEIDFNRLKEEIINLFGKARLWRIKYFGALHAKLKNNYNLLLPPIKSK